MIEGNIPQACAHTCSHTYKYAYTLYTHAYAKKGHKNCFEVDREMRRFILLCEVPNTAFGS